LAECKNQSTSTPLHAIQLTIKSLLRRVQDFAGFVITSVRLVGSGSQIHIEARLAADPRHKARCHSCQQPAPGYDTLPERRWQFVPLWQFPLILRYAPRRVHCPQCGIVVERLPWSEGKHPYSKAYMIFLARWARRLSWKETAAIFKTSWDAVCRSVQWVVEWGLSQRDLSGVSALGIDELHWGRGKKSGNFITLIYQIDAGRRRLLWVGHQRKEATLKEGFGALEKESPGFLQALRVICSDMWKPFLKVIAQKAGWALNVLDPFHIAQHLNAAVDTVRRGEQGRLRGETKKTAIKRGRFLLLKRGTRVRGHARDKLHAILRSMRQTARAWELKESFRQFWRYKSELWAAGFLDAWTSRALRSRLEPIKKVARMLRNHEELLFNYLRARREFTNAITEGLNHKARVCLARSFGHRTFRILQLVLYHNLANLPEPPSTHKFC
jgi:transposase